MNTCINLATFYCISLHRWDDSFIESFPLFLVVSSGGFDRLQLWPGLTFTVVSHEVHCISNQSHLNCLFGCLFGPSTKKTPRPRILALVRGIPLELVASLMSLMASLVTTSRMQQCFNVPIDSYHEFLLLFYCCVLLEIKLSTTTMDSTHKEPVMLDFMTSS